MLQEARNWIPRETMKCENRFNTLDQTLEKVPFEFDEKKQNLFQSLYIKFKMKSMRILECNEKPRKLSASES